MSVLRQYLLIGSGFASLSLGVLGIFIPLLPTTPFLLLAAACFFRSSDSLYRWIIRHRLFGNYIACYRQYRAVSVKTKIFTLLLLWAGIGYSAFHVAETWWLRLLLPLIAVGVTLHILRLRTLTAGMVAEIKKDAVRMEQIGRRTF